METFIPVTQVWTCASIYQLQDSKTISMTTEQHHARARPCHVVQSFREEVGPEMYILKLLHVFKKDIIEKTNIKSKIGPQYF